MSYCADCIKCGCKCVQMPDELTDDQADAALRATAVHLDIKGTQLTVNREKMKARYKALVKFIHEQGSNPSNSTKVKP